MGTKHTVQKRIAKHLSGPFYGKQFTGLLIIDAQNKDTLFKHNAQKYFIPASNTKIFTLYTALKLLPKNLPIIRYIEKRDTLYFEGMGNPVTLHPHFRDSTLVHFLRSKENVAFYPHNFHDVPLGPGWAWDDYQWYYSTERSGLPLYGNVLTVYGPKGTVHPTYFTDSIQWKEHPEYRLQQKNRFHIPPKVTDTLEIPFKTEIPTTRNLFEAALQKPVPIVDYFPRDDAKILYGTATDSVLVRMMLQSDNFLSEQLLIMASAVLSDSLNTHRAIDYMLEGPLQTLRQPPRWVDGSGLSRYNLFSPESMVHVLSQLYAEIPRERLFPYFPIGGKSGTLEDWYAGNPEPYVYAKTGSLGNNHNLSGYLLTQSGKTLIFSFMNNHFRSDSKEVKRKMQRILEFVRDSY
ncbi:MAG: D-alanyl-D-alanine carboxypeptidase/D-alanyl-D-alanine-endopeptidase [Flavobacteriaceae bacterium]